MSWLGRRASRGVGGGGTGLGACFASCHAYSPTRPAAISACMSFCPQCCSVRPALLSAALPRMRRPQVPLGGGPLLQQVGSMPRGIGSGAAAPACCSAWHRVPQRRAPSQLPARAPPPPPTPPPTPRCSPCFSPPCLPTPSCAAASLQQGGEPHRHEVRPAVLPGRADRPRRRPHRRLLLLHPRHEHRAGPHLPLCERGARPAAVVLPL